MKTRKLPKKKVVVKNFRKIDKFKDQTTLDKKGWDSYKANITQFSKLKVNDLKDLLQKNNAATSGAKD